MSNNSETPFADKFFQVPRRVTYLTLGSDHQNIFEYFKGLDLNGDECCCFLEATGIDVRDNSWRIGVFYEPVVVCGRLYPKHTVAVIQGMKPNSRVALFSVDDSDCDDIRPSQA